MERDRREFLTFIDSPLAAAALTFLIVNYTKVVSNGIIMTLPNGLPNNQLTERGSSKLLLSDAILFVSEIQ